MKCTFREAQADTPYQCHWRWQIVTARLTHVSRSIKRSGVGKFNFHVSGFRGGPWGMLIRSFPHLRMQVHAYIITMSAMLAQEVRLCLPWVETLCIDDPRTRLRTSRNCNGFRPFDVGGGAKPEDAGRVPHFLFQQARHLACSRI